MESSLYVERAGGLGWRRHPRYRIREGPAQREGDPQDRSCCRRRARLHFRNSRKDGEDQKHELSLATEFHPRSEKCHWRPISLRWSLTCDFPSIDVWTIKRCQYGSEQVSRFSRKWRKPFSAKIVGRERMTKQRKQYTV